MFERVWLKRRPLWWQQHRHGLKFLTADADQSDSPLATPSPWQRPPFYCKEIAKEYILSSDVRIFNRSSLSMNWLSTSTSRQPSWSLALTFYSPWVYLSSAPQFLSSNWVLIRQQTAPHQGEHQPSSVNFRNICQHFSASQSQQVSSIFQHYSCVAPWVIMPALYFRM